MSIRRAPERAWCPDERTRDDAADAKAFANKLVGRFARAIQLGDRHDLLVRGNLEYAVRRRVDDPRAGAHVFGTEVVDDLRPGCGDIADDAATGQP